MAEFAEVVRNRRMTRAFESTPIESSVLDEVVDLSSRAPSAGKTQGWHLVVLQGSQTSIFWDSTLPAVRRESFRWKQLLSAPVIALPLADAKAYTDRYGEPDKVQTGLGAGQSAWPVPYWTIDASMSVMTMLLAAENVGLGALFFGVFRGERDLRQALGIPAELELLGALALGYPVGQAEESAGSARSSGRRRRTPAQIMHQGRW
ncbi:MAG: nitroreductase family protein [Actinobacteria bacterium]|nr:MAG: nitroreductase family protein [Actinomycetota bacterium]